MSEVNRIPPALKLRRKLRLIQEQIGPVELQSAEGEDPFAFMPAAGVFEEVKRQLVKRKLLVLPKLARAETIEGNGGKRGTRVRLHITIVDCTSGESLSGEWAGESFDQDRALTHAGTSALKAFYILTFLIQPVESAPKDRNESRQRKRRLLITDRQISGPVAFARNEVEMSDADFGRLLRERFGVGDINQLPRDRVDELVTAIKTSGEGS